MVIGVLVVGFNAVVYEGEAVAIRVVWFPRLGPWLLMRAWLAYPGAWYPAMMVRRWVR